MDANWCVTGVFLCALDSYLLPDLETEICTLFGHKTNLQCTLHVTKALLSLCFFDLASPPHIDTGMHDIPLMLRNCFFDFAIEHWFGCHATEPGFARGYWRYRNLIDWYAYVYSCRTPMYLDTFYFTYFILKLLFLLACKLFVSWRNITNFQFYEPSIEEANRPMILWLCLFSAHMRKDL